jgi:2-polyprenyl-3-methyl-5-hydroxy-6-metoxy-1,4-benzoquinol methylase
MEPKLTGRGILEPELLNTSGPRASKHASERLLAKSYGLMYDAVVSGFPPYETLLDEVFAYVERSAPVRAGGPPPAVLDISCGIGTVAARLSARGYAVTGVDSVGHLVDVARRRHGGRRASLRFENVDVASAPVPGAGTFDVVLSMHTLYWHSRPDAVLTACRRMLKPGGHAVFLTYARPAWVLRTFADVRAANGLAHAVRALRWLVPTAVFEMLRHVDRRYLTEADFHTGLRAAAFEILDSRETFLAGISRLAWVRAPR